MSTKITFPIWRLADSTHKAEIQSLKATNLLIKFYQMKYEKQLQKLGFNLIFEKKHIHYKNKTTIQISENFMIKFINI
jgi:hypothetical protein